MKIYIGRFRDGVNASFHTSKNSPKYFCCGFSIFTGFPSSLRSGKSCGHAAASDADEEDIIKYSMALGLDKPIWDQYFIFLKNIQMAIWVVRSFKKYQRSVW